MSCTEPSQVNLSDTVSESVAAHDKMSDPDYPAVILQVGVAAENVQFKKPDMEAGLIG